MSQPINSYHKVTSKNGLRLNEQILDGFLKHYQRDNVRKTHLFGGRYENIYLTEQEIPELGALIAEATAYAEDLTQHKNLRAGFWFNFMPPGSTTTLHTHDDADELMSAVYYVDVPEASGNLVIYENKGGADSRKIELTPAAGEFIFFKPDVAHEVTRNNSSRPRLSIGINFGQP